MVQGVERLRVGFGNVEDQGCEEGEEGVYCFWVEGSGERGEERMAEGLEGAGLVCEMRC